jgi:hypothetical protein
MEWTILKKRLSNLQLQKLLMSIYFQSEHDVECYFITELLYKFSSSFWSLRKVMDFLSMLFIAVFGEKLFAALT